MAEMAGLYLKMKMPLNAINCFKISINFLSADNVVSIQKDSEH